MKRKILFGLTAVFFVLMLAGTFFHREIDSLFRIKVRLATIETGSEYVTIPMTIDGRETEITREEQFLLLPAEAVRDNMIYVVERVTVPYGSYDVVMLRVVQTAGVTEGKVKITGGLSESENVAAVYDDALCDGMRIVVEGQR
ncbi:MAG: hypothetical protein HDQ99_15800 [Lachnospiraceae bacterium]|nr:hypothetical protein [Lachnospiraceae bacterium]